MSDHCEDNEFLLERPASRHKKCKYESSEAMAMWPLSWWRRMGSMELFLVNFSIVAILQGATFTYMIGSLSTLEKRFAFESKISGIILIAEHVCQIIISPLVGYLGNRYNRPRIMAVGELFAAFSCFMFVIPYLIYGPSTHLLSSAQQSATDLCKSWPLVDECNSNTVWPAVYTLWAASFLNGIGVTAFYTIGFPYIDDNTSKKNSPLYLSVSSALRLLGPAIGLLMSSHFLKYYENPLIEPSITRTDPRWIGCWWLGFILIGTLLVIFAIPLAFYPEIRDKQKSKEADIRTNLMSIRHQVCDALDIIKRLSLNPIFVFHVLGVAFKLIGYLGYFIFKPKYIESQFRKSASEANFWAGLIILPTMAFGVISSGLFLTRFKPNARTVALYIFIIELIISGGVLYAKTFQCPVPIFPETNSLVINSGPPVCSSNCHCSTRVFQPVCSTNRALNYFSPCFAGCSAEHSGDGRAKKWFSDCKCDDSNGRVTDGYCATDCNQFVPYITFFAIISIIASTGKIGDTLITLRCVDPKDKNFAIGITGGFLAIFALIPYPVIFGAITDSACKIWEQSCGGRGNCWLYDIEKLTQYLHNSSFGFMIVGSVLHFFVVIYAKRIPNMFEDNDGVISSSSMESENSNNLSAIREVPKDI